MGRFLGAVLACVFCVGCSGTSPTQPTTPSTTPPASEIPVVRLQIRVDGGTPGNVIASISEVVVDASGSTGTGPLVFTVDFGDGTVATTATARHVYATPGTFTIVADVADAQGRKALSVSTSITVKAVTQTP
jgi:hypothetical protein